MGKNDPETQIFPSLFHPLGLASSPELGFSQQSSHNRVRGIFLCRKCHIFCYIFKKKKHTRKKKPRVSCTRLCLGLVSEQRGGDTFIPQSSFLYFPLYNKEKKKGRELPEAHPLSVTFNFTRQKVFFLVSQPAPFPPKTRPERRVEELFPSAPFPASRVLTKSS